MATRSRTGDSRHTCFVVTTSTPPAPSPDLLRADLAYARLPSRPRPVAATPETRLPRKGGAGGATAYPLLPEFAGLGVARPALAEPRYFPRVVIGDRRAEVALAPLVASCGAAPISPRDVSPHERGHVDPSRHTRLLGPAAERRQVSLIMGGGGADRRQYVLLDQRRIVSVARWRLVVTCGRPLQASGGLAAESLPDVPF